VFAGADVGFAAVDFAADEIVADAASAGAVVELEIVAVG